MSFWLSLSECYHFSVALRLILRFPFLSFILFLFLGFCFCCCCLDFLDWPLESARPGLGSQWIICCGILGHLLAFSTHQFPYKQNGGSSGTYLPGLW